MEKTKNEIKKSLYKEKPTAVYQNVNGKGEALFRTTLKSKVSVEFLIPREEQEGFEKEMPAQLLIRWMVEPKHTT